MYIKIKLKIKWLFSSLHPTSVFSTFCLPSTFSHILRIFHYPTGNKLTYFFFFNGCTCAIWMFPGLGLNQSCGCQLMPQPPQCQIWVTSAIYTTAGGNTGSLSHWARPEIEPVSSQRLCCVLNPLSHNGNSWHLLIKALTLCLRAPPSWPHHLQIPSL